MSAKKATSSLQIRAAREFAANRNYLSIKVDWFAVDRHQREHGILQIGMRKIARHHNLQIEGARPEAIGRKLN